MAGQLRLLVLSAVLVSAGGPSLSLAQTPAPIPTGTPADVPPKRNFPLRRLGPPPAGPGSAEGRERPDGAGRPGGPGGPARKGIASPEFDHVRKAIEALSPEQRQRFQENFRRWSNLSVEDMKALREREEWRRQKMEVEIDEGVKEAGLVLSPDQRQRFAQRYGEERRQIEEQLRRDLEEKRRPLVRQIVARLKAEFAGLPAPAPAPTPAAPVPPP